MFTYSEDLAKLERAEEEASNKEERKQYIIAGGAALASIVVLTFWVAHLVSSAQWEMIAVLLIGFVGFDVYFNFFSEEI